MPRFSLRFDLRSYTADHADLPRLYAAALEQCAWGDRLGFSMVTLSEHHGSEDGYLPSPLLMAAAVAARTTRLRIMLSILIVPLYDPLRLAEDLAVLDVLSGGRVVAVLGGGYVEREFQAFGKKLSDRKEVMEEIVGLLRQAWSGEPFEYRGRTVRVTPRPHTRPWIWMGGSSKVAARRAARDADYFAPNTEDLFDVYREELRRLGKPDPGPRGASTGSFLHLASDPDHAWEEIGPYLMHENNAYARWAEESGVNTPYTYCASMVQLRDSGRYPVMTPTALLERIATMGRQDTVLFHPLAGGMDPELAWRSLRLFEQQVWPQLQGLKA